MIIRKKLNNNYSLVSFNSIDKQHGFVVNSKMQKHELIYNIRTDTHNLIIDETGSGKTQNLVLPTIAINAKSKIKPSMIITDSKDELHQYQKDILISASYKVQIINLRTVTENIAWNPLQPIYDQFKTMLLSTNSQEKLTIRVAIQSDIQDLSKALFANNNQVEPFWNDSGVLLTEVIILAMLEDV